MSNEVSVTKADGQALDRMPNGWFTWMDVITIRRPEWRLERLRTNGILESRLKGVYPNCERQYRKRLGAVWCRKCKRKRELDTMLSYCKRDPADTYCEWVSSGIVPLTPLTPEQIHHVLTHKGPDHPDYSGVKIEKHCPTCTCGGES